jgi:hypothetical protein
MFAPIGSFGIHLYRAAVVPRAGRIKGVSYGEEEEQKE